MIVVLIVEVAEGYLDYGVTLWVECRVDVLVDGVRGGVDVLFCLGGLEVVGRFLFGYFYG